MAPLPPSPVACAAAAALYAGTAIALAFTNKAVLSVFPESNVMLLFQMLAAAGGVGAMSRARLVEVSPLSVARARSLAPVSALYCSNVAFALASLDGLSVPVYTMLKRLTPAVVLAANAVSGRPPGARVTASTLLTVGGCILAGAGDLAFDTRAYSFALTSCVLQTCYLLAVERAKGGLSSHELLLYNSLLSVPLLLLICVLDGELLTAPASLRRLAYSGIADVATLVAAIILGVALNFSIFLCTRINSALTTTIVGIVKGVATTVLGFLLLGGVRDATWLLLGGLALNTIGGSWYGWLEYETKAEVKKPAQGQQHYHADAPAEVVGHSGSPRGRAPSIGDGVAPRTSGAVTRRHDEQHSV